MNRPVKRLAAAAAAMFVAAACGDGTGVKSGNLTLALTGPVPARAAQFRVVGPQTGVTAGSASLHVYVTPLAGDTTMVAVVAAVGHTLAESNVATLAVPDVGAVASYSVTLLQVAAANYTLQNAASYTVTLH